MNLSRAWRRAAVVLPLLLAAATTSHAREFGSALVFVKANQGTLTRESMNGSCDSGGDFVCLPGPTEVFDFDGFTAAASQAYGIPGQSWTAKLLLLDGGLWGLPTLDGLAYESIAPDDYLFLRFDAPVTAVGFVLAAVSNGAPASFQVDWMNGSTVLHSALVAAADVFTPTTFIGVSGIGAITEVRIASTSSDPLLQSFFVDNLYFGGAPLVAEVPEPANWALLLIGLGALARRRRR